MEEERHRLVQSDLEPGQVMPSNHQDLNEDQLKLSYDREASTLA